MPRVKIDYVVSFSNEDPENPASNLLSWDVSKKRWLCARGEPSCSIVLQLTRAIKISSVQIGAHNTALVEVLVSRSETPTEPFQVLVPRSVFLSPAESRAAEGADRVRSFADSALATASAQRWDRVRVVCSQPYNKHCKYGMSFIHIFEPDPPAATPGAPAATPVASTAASGAPIRGFELPTFSSDEEDFRPGELFAKHQQSKSPASAPTPAVDTGAQIRQATSQALKNNPEASVALVKTPLSKNKPAPAGGSAPSVQPTAPGTTRDRGSLVYTEDDGRPHAKIDRIVQRHKEQKCKNEANTTKPKKKTKESDRDDRTPHRRGDEVSAGARADSETNASDRRGRDDDEPHGDTNGASTTRKDSTRKRSHSYRRGAGDERALAGLVCVLSGYQHPRRGALRDLALSLGASVQREWGPRCTHLICAFSKTPKLVAVRAGPRGDCAVAVRGEWLEACAAAGSRVPWPPYAAEPHLRRDAAERGASERGASERGASERGALSDCDTDDEIEKALRQQKKHRGAGAADRHDARRDDDAADRHDARRDDDAADRHDARRDYDAADRHDARRDDDDDVEFVLDERMQGNVTVEDSDAESAGSCDGDTDAEAGPVSARERISAGATLPPLFAGRTFVLDESAVAPLDGRLLARYCLAYGGLVLAPSEAEGSSECHYVVCGGESARRWSSGGAVRVRGDWLWACHRAKELLPTAPYEL